MAKKVAEKKVEKKVEKKAEKKVEKKVAAKKGAKKVVEVKKAMTKGEMIASLAEKTGLNKKQVEDAYNNLAVIAAEQVKSVGEFTLPGFGKFVVAKRAARTGRNPQTGAEIKIEEKRIVKMKVSKTFADAVIA